MVPPACMKKSSRSLLRTGAWKPLSPIPNRADRLRRSSSIWTYGGLREELYDIARKVAVVGFYVVLPDLYYGQGRVGSIGYCMGGRHLMWVAGAYPERFIAGASLHGTQLVSDRDDSPHRLADRIRGQLYCGFAEKDPNATPPIRQAL